MHGHTSFPHYRHFFARQFADFHEGHFFFGILFVSFADLKIASRVLVMFAEFRRRSAEFRSRFAEFRSRSAEFRCRFAEFRGRSADSRCRSSHFRFGYHCSSEGESFRRIHVLRLSSSGPGFC